MFRFFLATALVPLGFSTTALDHLQGELSLDMDEGLEEALSLLQRKVELKTATEGHVLHQVPDFLEGHISMNADDLFFANGSKKPPVHFNASLGNRGSYYRKALHIKGNRNGDLNAFYTAITINLIVVCVTFTIASVLRLRYPMMYQWNTLMPSKNGPKKDGPEPTIVYNDPEAATETYFGWIKETLGLDVAANAKASSLDHAMLLEFCNFCMRVMLVIGAPHLLILAPVHALKGGNAAGDDHLSYVAFGNVTKGNPITWVHAVVVWFTVAAVQYLVFDAQGRFLEHRVRWLKELPYPRCNTIMLENIPEKHQGDIKLREYIDDLFGEDVVARACMVLHTKALRGAKDRLTKAEASLEKAELDWEHNIEKVRAANKKAEEEWETNKEKPRPEPKDERDVKLRPSRGHFDGRDAIESFQEDIRMFEKELESERDKMEKQLKIQGGLPIPGLHSDSAFVTFKKRTTCEHALIHNFDYDEDVFSCEMAPDPNDVQYEKLKLDSSLEAGSNVLGYCCAVGLFVGFLPLVIGITAVTSVSNLEGHISFFNMLMHEYPAIADAWDGLVGSLLLTMLVGFIPTFLVLIFDNFFVLKSAALKQVKVMEWYYYFQVVFVLLVTAIGASLMGTLHDIMENPGSILVKIAASMPQSTHFYLNFMAAAWASHGTALMRHSLLGKFLFFRKLYGDEDRAKAKAEPEDQGYFGMGARSARLTLLLVTTLTFCTLSPLITILCFINFAISRVAYGYLFVFAETIKPDLGGEFWVSQMKHVQQGLGIYIIVMVAVLLERSPTSYPAAAAGSAFVLLIVSYGRFDRAYHWKNLPLSAVKELAKDEKTHQAFTEYVYEEPLLRTEDCRVRPLKA